MGLDEAVDLDGYRTNMESIVEAIKGVFKFIFILVIMESDYMVAFEEGNELVVYLYNHPFCFI